MKETAEVIAQAPDWNLVIGLIGFFGTVISLLLAIIGWILNRAVTRIDTRLDRQDDRIENLQVSHTETKTKVDNLMVWAKG